MPYVSKAQNRYLHAKKPQVAKEFDEHTAKGAVKKLPERVKPKKSKVAKKAKK